MENSVEKELEYFNKNYSTLFEQYPNEWIIIKDSSVMYHSNNKTEILEKALKQFELGQFLLKQVIPQEEYNHRFFSRVFI